MSSSPAWKNPRDRLVKHVKRKSSRVLLLSQPTTSSAVDFNTESCPPMTASPGLANPFKIRSPTKKRVRVSEEEPLKELQFDFDDSTANDSFSTSVKTKIQEVTDSPRLGRSRSMQVFGEYSLDFSDISNVFGRTQSTSSSPAVPEPKFSTTLPQDLRLGTKLRVTSKQPFPWMKNTRSTGNVLVRVSGEDRSRGMQHFIDYPEDAASLQTELQPANPMSLLEAASFYWQYPALPWLSLYPRIESLLKSQPKQSAPPLAPTMTELINKQWFDSLDQLYISWKKGERKNFYVVCPSFTVLFNKTRQTVTEEPEEDSVSCFQVADGQRHVAIISPTNLGFRQYLKKEGVSFELCSYKRRRLSRLRTEESLDNADCSRMSSMIDPASEKRDVLDEIDIFDEDKNDENEAAAKKPSVTTSDPEEESPTKGTSGVQEWLEAVGVSPRNQLKWQRHKSMISTVTTLQGSNRKEVDKDVTSAVIITEGASLQSLYNLLQNSKVTRSIAGAHANLPPTLIASKPFLFGQMLSLKKMSQVLKRQGQPTEYVLELDGGPVMQHSIELMSQFVHSAGLTAKDSASIRINDKSAYAGLNGIDQSNEWNEIAVEKDGFMWK